jgi:fatty acid desaturase
MERSFLFASEYGFIVSQAAEFVTKRRKKAPGAGALRGRKIRVYFAAISAAAAVQRSVIGLPPSGAGCTMPGTPCSAPMEGGCAVFSDFVPELLKITQFYHFFMLK